MEESKSLQWWYSLSLPARLLMVGLAAPILVLNFWAVSSILHYFGVLVGILIVSSLLAFLLNYPVSWLVAHGAQRGPASIVVFLLTLALLTALGIILVPVVIAQAQQLVLRLPDWVESGQQQLIVLSQRAEEAGVPIDLDAVTTQLVDRLREQLQVLTRGVLNLAVGTVSGVLDILIDGVITVVLTFYLVQHGDELWDSLVQWLPVRLQQPFSQTLRLSFQNYFLGQLILGTSMASTLIPIFLILKVPFGLLFGLTIGTMALIPFGGSVGIAVVTLLVTLQNFWLGMKVLIASLIVQQIVDNLIAPRILGSVTGLNPVWVFISILTGARVAGLLGVVLAVPTAFIVKVALVALRSRLVLPAAAVDITATAADEAPSKKFSEVS